MMTTPDSPGKQKRDINHLPLPIIGERVECRQVDYRGATEPVNAGVL